MSRPEIRARPASDARGARGRSPARRSRGGLSFWLWGGPHLSTRAREAGAFAYHRRSMPRLKHDDISITVQSERAVLAAVRLPPPHPGSGYDPRDPFGELKALAEQAGAI